jgi:hypothetical protein
MPNCGVGPFPFSAPTLAPVGESDTVRQKRHGDSQCRRKQHQQTGRGKSAHTKARSPAGGSRSFDSAGSKLDYTVDGSKV